MARDLAGAALVVLALVDVFFTVLHVGPRGGLVAMRVARAAAVVLRRVAKPDGKLASLRGPIVLSKLFLTWIVMLGIGVALVVRPAVFVLVSIMALSAVALVITYLTQIASALQRRNAVAFELAALSGSEGDGVELVARLGMGGRFDASTATTAELGAELCALEESHRFYPVLAYFRFAEPFYVAALDAMTLMRTALDEQLHGWVAESANVTRIWSAAAHLLEFFAAPAEREEPSDEELALWSAHWNAALPRLRAAGIATTYDEDTGFERYVALRAGWNRLAPVIQREPWGSRGGSSSPSYSSS
jgi:hypothetical protein